jgi:hypothetical protein
MAIIGVAVAARLARDNRTHELAIVAVIALIAVAGMGRASRARTFARLVAWDKRRRLASQVHGLVPVGAQSSANDGIAR